MDSSNCSNGNSIEDGLEESVPIKPLPSDYPITKPLKGLLKQNQSLDLSVDGHTKSKKHVKFADTMMVFCDDWPEEMMPQLIALEPQTSNYNLVEIVASDFMFDPPVEYRDLQHYDPPPDYQDCVSSGKASILYEKDTSITFIDEDGVPYEATYHSLGPALQWENILNESELQEEDIIGVLKEDEILQAIGSQTADIDTVFHPPEPDEESLDEGDFPVHYQTNDLSRDDMSNNFHGNVDNNNINISESNFKNGGEIGCMDKASQATENSETMSEAEDLSSDLASDSSFTSQDTIILTTSINNSSDIRHEVKSNPTESPSKKNIPVSVSDSPKEYQQIDVSLEYEPKVCKPVMEIINDDGDEDEDANDANEKVSHEKDSDFKNKPNEIQHSKVEHKHVDKPPDSQKFLEFENRQILRQESQEIERKNATLRTPSGSISSVTVYSPPSFSSLASSSDSEQMRREEICEPVISGGRKPGNLLNGESVTQITVSNSRQNTLQAQSDRSSSYSPRLSSESPSSSPSSTLPLSSSSSSISGSSLKSEKSSSTAGNNSSSISVSAIRKAFEKKESEPVYQNTSSPASTGIRNKTKCPSSGNKRPKSFPFTMGKSGDESKTGSIIKEATNVMTGKLKWLSLSDEKGMKNTGEKNSDVKQQSCNQQVKNANDNANTSASSINKTWPKEDLMIEYTSEPRRKVHPPGYHQINQDQVERVSLSSSTVSQENEAKDELVQFVENGIQRIERIKRRYSLSDEGDDPTFGFGRRPSVRGIKPRYGTTNEIIRHMQMQLRPAFPSQSVTAPIHNTIARQAIVTSTQALNSQAQITRTPRPALVAGKPILVAQLPPISQLTPQSAAAIQFCQQHALHNHSHIHLATPSATSIPQILPPQAVRHVYLIPQGHNGPRYTLNLCRASRVSLNCEHRRANVNREFCKHQL